MRKLHQNIPRETNLLTKEEQQFWSNQTYMSILPGLVEPACIHRARAIIAPDFYHWLKSSEGGRRAELQPSIINSAFRLAENETGLLLDPPLNPDGPNTSGVGGTVDPLPHDGWSWFERMAAVPVRDV